MSEVMQVMIYVNLGIWAVVGVMAAAALGKYLASDCHGKS